MCLCERITRGDHVAFRFSPAAGGKKTGKKRGIERAAPPPLLPPPARTRQRVCARQAGRRRGNPISRMRAGLTRLSRGDPAWRFIDTLPASLGCPLIGRFIVPLLIPPVWFYTRYLIFPPSRSFHAFSQFRVTRCLSSNIGPIFPIFLFSSFRSLERKYDK